MAVDIPSRPTPIRTNVHIEIETTIARRMKEMAAYLGMPMRKLYEAACHKHLERYDKGEANGSQ